MSIKYGKFTVPGDKDFLEGTKKLMKYWGADGIRDCDGTELPENAHEFSDKVYKTYFLARGNNEYAYAHKEYLQNVVLTTKRITATKKELNIDLLDGYYKDQLEVNDSSDALKYLEVFDRTINEKINDYYYDNDTKSVRINNVTLFHEYQVNFFARQLWDPTQIYNYVTNGWTCTKDRCIDPIYDEADKKIYEDLENWLINNPNINVVRFTTFFYHFFLVKDNENRNKYFDWFGYSMSASPMMFKRFKEKYNYDIVLEDVITSGYYANSFLSPSKTYLDYIDLVQEFVSIKVKRYVDLCHKYSREAIMFLGDNWIGAEPYGKYFKDMGLDAVVGSVSSGTNLRMLSEIPHVKYTEARLMPYFFPDSLADDIGNKNYLIKSWVNERRAFLRKPVDRIGFGGYLKLIENYPMFIDSIKDLADEFRSTHELIHNEKPYAKYKIAIINDWGKIKSWLTNMFCQDAKCPENKNYINILESLSGMNVDVDFINFEDCLNNDLSFYDSILNFGEVGTSSIGNGWSNPKVIEKISEYVYNGGSILGVGDATAIANSNNGKYFQLANIFGVDKEVSKSIIEYKYNFKEVEHEILDNIDGEIDFGNEHNFIYAYENTKVLKVKKDKNLWFGPNNHHILMAINEFGKGRAFYMAGYEFNNTNTRVLENALSWLSHKEKDLKKVYSDSIDCEINYYPTINKYIVVNNTDKVIKTNVYDINGDIISIELKSYEMKVL